MDTVFRAILRPWRVSLALAWCLVLVPVRLEAQCTLQASGLVSFEPKPPGEARPAFLSSGFNSNLALYQSGGSGSYRLLMQESFGYSVLDLSNPINPTALHYHDVRFPINGANSVTQHGDGQNIIQTIAVTPDGQRVAFATTGPAAPFQTVVGAPDGGNAFTLWGDFFPDRAAGTLIQNISGRYIAYDIHSSLATASDITTLPSTLLEPNNMGHELTTWPGGFLASLAGNYILYMAGGAIQVIDASHPGPVGSITAGFPQTTITSADFGGRTIAYYSAAVDPADATKLWVLVELNALPGLPPPAGNGENSPSYGLLSITSNLQKVSAGPIWRVPSQAGEVWWSNPGPSSALIPGNGSIFVLMWAQRALPGLLFELYSTTTAAWDQVGSSAPPGKFDIPTSLYGNFSTGQPMRGFATADSSLYAYLPTGTSAYVIPMSCVSQNAPAVASMAVANKAGAPLARGDTVFLGDQITITPSVSPSPASQPLTGFGWNFDFDFHAALEETGTSPHISVPDAGASSIPPSPFTLVGPCDPRALPASSVNPATGLGCWISATTNAASGGPDFAASPAAGTSVPLTFAFEANNSLGSAGLSTFTLNWKVPAAKLQSTQVLSGQPLVSASDGQPTATGFKWYFGATGTPLVLDTACTGPTCVPPLDTTGKYSYWLTASYANGYATPDYAGTDAGTYIVTDFAPFFTVNGSANGPVTAVINQSLNVLNSSQLGTGVATSGGYFYSLCQIPSGQTTCTDAYTSWLTMGDPTSGQPITSATIPVPAAAGSFALKIQAHYLIGNTGGSTANWPDSAGIAFFPVTVVDVVPLAVTVSVNPPTLPAGQFVTFTCNVTGGLAPYTYQWNSPIQFKIPGQTQPTYQATQTIAGPLQALCNVTDSLSKSAFNSAVATFTGSAPPPPPPPSGGFSVTVSANPNPALVNQSITFSCNVSGGTPPYTYTWRSPSTSPFPAGSQPNFTTSSPAAGTLTAGCTVADSAGSSQTNSMAVTIVAAAPPPAACSGVDFKVRDVKSGNLVPLTGGIIGTFYTVSAGESLSFEPAATYGSYLWDFGDRTPQDTTAQPKHAYAVAGQYTVTLEVEGNSGCNRSYKIQASGASGAFAASYADGSPFDETQITPGKLVSFLAIDADDGSTTFAWDFGDGGTATGPTPAHAFNAFGVAATYTVSLTVTKGSQSGSTSQPFTVVPPPEPPKWFVGGMAFTTGAIQGTVWQSDVTILNPHPTLPATYSVAFLDGNKAVDPKDLAFKTFTVGPEQSAESKNILGDFFGLPLGSFGAIIVRGDAAPVPPTITSRTFNNGDPAKGSYGLSVPPTQTVDGSLPAGSTAPQLLIGLRDDDTSYTNVGLVNLISSDWSHAHLTYADAAGAKLGVLNVDVPPYGVAQLNKPLTTAVGPDGLGLPSSSLYRVQVTVDAGGAVYPYATVIDATSTDPIIVTPAVSPSTSYLIPGIVRQTGRNGEHFRSRVTIFNPSSASRTVRVTLGYVLCDGDSCGLPSSLVGDVKMAPGQSQSWDDFVKVWFSAFDHSDVSDTKDYKFSFVDVRPAPGDAVTDPLIVLGETYNETPNGSASNGRVGFQIPGYTPADGAGSAVSGKRLVLAGLASTAAFRTNIALFAVAGVTTNWCAVHVYAQDGTKLRDVPVQVAAFSSVSDSTLFGGLPGGPYSIVVDSIDDGVTVGGYATIIDNLSGDATFVKAQPAP